MSARDDDARRRPDSPRAGPPTRVPVDRTYRDRDPLPPGADARRPASSSGSPTTGPSSPAAPPTRSRPPSPQPLGRRHRVVVPDELWLDVPRCVPDHGLSGGRPRRRRRGRDAREARRRRDRDCRPRPRAGAGATRHHPRPGPARLRRGRGPGRRRGRSTPWPLSTPPGRRPGSADRRRPATSSLTGSRASTGLGASTSCSSPAEPPPVRGVGQRRLSSMTGMTRVVFCS